MKRTLKLLFALGMVVCAAAAEAQGLDPAQIGKPAIDSWTTYSGDYSGRRFSPLTQINQANIKNLGLSWVSHLARSATLPGWMRRTRRRKSPRRPGRDWTAIGDVHPRRTSDHCRRRN